MPDNRCWSTLSDAVWIEHATQQRNDAMQMRGEAKGDYELLLSPTSEPHSRVIREDWEGRGVAWPASSDRSGEWSEGYLAGISIQETGRREVTLLIRTKAPISAAEKRCFAAGHIVKIQPPKFLESLAHWSDARPAKSTEDPDPDGWFQQSAGCVVPGRSAAPIPGKVSGQLSESKGRAIAQQGREVMAIWGPPGTGKTYALAQICASRLRDSPSFRIAVLSISNRAVDVAALEVDDAWRKHSEADGRRDHPSVLAEDDPARHHTLVRARAPHKEDMLLKKRGHMLSGYERTVRPYKDSEADLVAQLKEAKTTADVTRIKAELLDNKQALNEALQKLFDSARCLFTTIAHARMTGRFDLSKFDMVVVDEAGFVPAAAMFWIKDQCSGELVVAGDFNQLSSIVNYDPREPKRRGLRPFPQREFFYMGADGKRAVKHFPWVDDVDERKLRKPMMDAWFGASIFDVLGVADSMPGGDAVAAAAREDAERDGWFCMLRETRRLPPAVCEFVSERTYGETDALIPHGESKLGPIVLDDGQQPEILWVDATGHKVLTGRGASSWFSEPIAKAAARLSIQCALDSMEEVLQDEFRVFVLARYRAQVRTLKKALRDQLAQTNGLDKAQRAAIERAVQMSTVHKVQGDEADVVIFATVQTRPWFVGQEGGWREELRLCNVVVSRTRRQVVVFIDTNDLSGEGHPYWDAYRKAAQELNIKDFHAASPGERWATYRQLRTIRKNEDAVGAQDYDNMTLDSAKRLMKKLSRLGRV